MNDNHIGRLRDNSYDEEQYYDDWYDQTEIKSELFEDLILPYDEIRENHRNDDEENIDNYYNGD